MNERSPHVRESGIVNRENFCLRNPEYGKCLLVESGIMGCGIRNPSTTDKESEFSTWTPESTMCNPESKSVLDSLTWDKKEELKPRISQKLCCLYGHPVR